MNVLRPVRIVRTEDGAEQPALLFHLPDGSRAIASAPYGGGIGAARWVLNAKVSKHYRRADPSAHLDELRRAAGLAADGVGLLTAAEVDGVITAIDDGVEVAATVGLSFPTWAATNGPRGSQPIAGRDDPLDPVEVVAAPGDPRVGTPSEGARVGTINIVAWVPAALGDAALVNAVATATEAKVQALGDAGIPGTGTATDAVVIACPVDSAVVDGAAEAYGGPRSRWGAPLARAIRDAVEQGARAW